MAFVRIEFAISISNDINPPRLPMQAQNVIKNISLCCAERPLPFLLFCPYSLAVLHEHT